MEQKIRLKLKRYVFGGVVLCLCIQGLSGVLTGCAQAAQSKSEACIPSDDQVEDIVYMYPCYTSIPDGLHDVQEAINKITVKKIGVRVLLRPVLKASYNQQVSLMMQNDGEVDLLTVQGNYDQLALKGELLDLNRLVETYGQGIKAALGELYDRAVIGEHRYGVPVVAGRAMSAHFIMRRDLLEETGVDIRGIMPVDDIMDMDENLKILEDVFQGVRKAHPDMEICIVPNSKILLEKLINYDPMNDELGVLMLGENSNQVVNLYETQAFEKLVRLAMRWSSLGYISREKALNMASATELLGTGEAFADIVYTQQGVEAQYKQSTGYDFTAVCMMKPVIISRDYDEAINCIPASSKNPVGAMKFLNLMYTDPEIVNLMAYGVPGKHYVFTQDGTVDYPPGITAAESPYPCVQTWLFGNTLLDHVKAGNDPKLYEIQAENMASAPRSPAFGFSYDSTPVESQVRACQDLVEQYKYGLLCGGLDLEMLEAFNAKLKEAGIDDIIMEKQRQFDAWREKNAN